MNIKHFFASSNALRSYWEDFAAMGVATRNLPPTEALQKLRPIGLGAEMAMYQATGGINTHKGAIFSIGLFCAAAGRLSPEHWTPERLCEQCAAMAKGIVAADFAGVTKETAKTVGEQLYADYGITGVRGQAEAGFPAVLNTGLPVLRQGLLQGLSLNDAGCATLLHLLCATEDTNMIARSDLATFRAAQAQIAGILAEDPYPSQDILEQLDAQFIEQNLSPGGTADLLAATCFLHFWKEEAP
jgi:holo-ACP synthase/triphosphoribosyl-dephospho-CoA synthase